MKLKMCTTGKTFAKTCLKNNIDTFLQHVVYNQWRDGVRHEGKGEGSIFQQNFARCKKIHPVRRTSSSFTRVKLCERPKVNSEPSHL